MSIKTKNTILVVGIILTAFISYQIAISRTLAAKTYYQTLKLKQLKIEQAPKQLSILKQQQSYYDSLLTKHELLGTSIQNNLLKTISIFAISHNLKIISFLEPHSIKSDNQKIITYQFTVEGDYNNIIKLIYQLEQHTKFGEIININFIKKKNFKTGKWYLECLILLKSLE